MLQSKVHGVAISDFTSLRIYLCRWLPEFWHHTGTTWHMTSQFPQPTCWVRRRTCQALNTVRRNKTELNYTEVCNNNLVINSIEVDKIVDATMVGDKVVVDVTWREVKQSLTALRWRRTLRVFLSFSYLSHTPRASTSAPSTEYDDRNLILCQSSDVLQTIQLHGWSMSEAD